ncbi:Rho-binding antiterminator [Aliiglaciecola sp. CAU 1673]|uniref:Rho-binding antiterminator n=1 Tax=Aliiglaciecola sp. CAU 1673 TaxID=3032595 RepID=UPI0023DC2BE1|nr:Rho-binding antiterminator [Aliiglaciecola sp. CAU 1673]MDF2180122.1 Rho-binding antiterminator [Aliiglaciecola sp. CAU 1673]
MPLNCNMHDNLEVACLYGYELEVEMTNGALFCGRAVTTETRPGPMEVLVLNVKGQHLVIAMTEIRIIRAITTNPYFSQLDINPQ